MAQSAFIWLSEQHWSRIDGEAQREAQYTCYFIPCDLEYPPELRDSDSDYPLAPERVAVTLRVLSDKQVEVARQYL